MSVTDRILGTLTTVIRMNNRVEHIAVLMQEQQRRIGSLNARVIRLESILELTLCREVPRLSGADDS